MLDRALTFRDAIVILLTRLNHFGGLTMSYADRDTYGIYKQGNHKGPGPELMGANTLTGETVVSRHDEHLGEIKEFMLDMHTGKVAYAVLARGGVFTLGEKLYAVPFDALTLDTENKCFVLDVAKERFDNAPGFDSDDWPDMADPTWSHDINSYYGSGLNERNLS
jgi:sporulation protein YlmC with PRC-barrel domain